MENVIIIVVLGFLILWFVVFMIVQLFLSKDDDSEWSELRPMTDEEEEEEGRKFKEAWEDESSGFRRRTEKIQEFFAESDREGFLKCFEVEIKDISNTDEYKRKRRELEEQKLDNESFNELKQSLDSFDSFDEEILLEDGEWDVIDLEPPGTIEVVYDDQPLSEEFLKEHNKIADAFEEVYLEDDEYEIIDLYDPRYKLTPTGNEHLPVTKEFIERHKKSCKMFSEYYKKQREKKRKNK